MDVYVFFFINIFYVLKICVVFIDLGIVVENIVKFLYVFIYDVEFFNIFIVVEFMVVGGIFI